MICLVCNLSKDSDSFWDTHQTMSDGHIWCTKKSKK
jgi:hypothetical protein